MSVVSIVLSAIFATENLCIWCELGFHASHWRSDKTQKVAVHFQHLCKTLLQLLTSFVGLCKSLDTCIGEGHKAAKLRVKQQQVAGVAKVIGISKLKSKYEPFEAKRQLCNSYDLFVADDRIVPSLPKLIGAHKLSV